MSDFDTLMESLQVEWRESHVDSKAHGYQNGHQRAWILPQALWEEGLWPPLRSDGDHSVPSYLSKNGVSKHTGSHNLKSSWVSGANLYFPFGRTQSGRTLLAAFLSEHVDSRIRSVDAVELEYAEEDALSPAELLGEGGGSRGSGQTSPDIAVLVNDGSGLLLVENKLTEHSFSPCSARTKRESDTRPANPDPSRCFDVSSVTSDPCAMCHQEVWGRKYWTLLKDASVSERMESLRRCPAATAGYQLFRQQALAEGIATSGKYDLVASCVALDARNEVLRHSLRSTGVEDVALWGDLFVGRAGFKVFTHQDWTHWVREHGGPDWGNWSDWIGDRYAI